MGNAKASNRGTSNKYGSHAFFVSPHIGSRCGLTQTNLMQERHSNRLQYFNELANTAREYYIDYLKNHINGFFLQIGKLI